MVRRIMGVYRADRGIRSPKLDEGIDHCETPASCVCLSRWA